MIRFKVPPSTEVSFNDSVRGEVTFNTEVIGDPVLVRSDGRPAYNFAVVIDDALMEVTHVIRGEDHISNTPRQLLLYRALGFTPPQFAHLALVMGPDHTPLSKRHGATSVAEFRLRGYLPEALVNYLALIGWSPGASASDPGTNEELLPVAELARRFAIEDVGHAAGIFDVEKLSWMNRHYMKVAAPGRIAAESMRYFLAQGLRPEEDRCGARVRLVAAADGGGIGRSAGGDSGARAVRLRVRCGACRCSSRTSRTWSTRPARARSLPRCPTRSRDRCSTRSRSAPSPRRVRERTGLKGKALFHPIRVALTGSDGGPELDLAVPAIDRGAALPASAAVAKIVSCKERALAFARRRRSRGLVRQLVTCADSRRTRD